MAACPCGCGQNLGFMKRRVALHAMDVAVAFPIVARLNEIAPSLPAEARPDAKGLLDAGEQMAAAMLAQAHGENVPSYLLPTPADLNDWRQAANMAAGSVYIADPQWMDSYVASLPADQRRLVGSMLSWAQARLG